MPVLARRLAALLAFALLAVLTSACDDDGDGASAGPDPALTAPYLSLAETRSVLERGRAALVRTGRGEAASAGEVEQLVESARLESQTGRELDVFVFASVAAARGAVPSVVDLEGGGSGIRAANVVAAFHDRFGEVDAYQAVAQAMRRLAVACNPGDSGEARLRELCFDPEQGVPPAGEGVDRDEAEGEERPVVVDGLRYDPLVARRLNPRIEPDSEILSGRLPGEGMEWFGVFLRVCNDGDRERRSSGAVALVNASGGRVAPSDALPSSNPFVYSAQAIEPEDCIPAAGSVAERVSGGALVLFAVPADFLVNRPVALEVAGSDGERERVILDL